MKLAKYKACICEGSAESAIIDAIPIESGKMLDEAVSPTVAPRRAEASPSQNNPSSAVKADRGAV